MNTYFTLETQEVLNFLLTDKDFKNEYDLSTAISEGITYEDTLNYFLNSIYIQHYFTSRKYLDISYLELSTKDIVNLDTLYIDYQGYLEDEYKLFN